MVGVGEETAKLPQAVRLSVTNTSSGQAGRDPVRSISADHSIQATEDERKMTNCK